MKTSVIALVLVMLSGCSSVHYQRAEVLNRHNDISTLKDRIDIAAASEVDVLAPKQFDEAKSKLDAAVHEAQKSQDPNAGNHTAELGLKSLNEAEKLAQEARRIFVDALAKRKLAEEAHAHLLYVEEFSALDRELKDAARKLAEGNKKEALEKNATLATRYQQLEVRALKANISEMAEKAYAKAVAAHAERLAPLTMKSAKSELDIARSIIDVEKGNYSKAQFHADQARYLAMRARYLAELITGFKKEKLSEEEIMLWYQSQLEQIHKPMTTEIKFDKDNKSMVEGFKTELQTLVSQLHTIETKTVASEKDFREVSALFSPDEAEVLRRGNDLIIRSYGFYFPVGGSELVSQNYELLHKIVKAINKFPKAEIEVEGHTDSSGSHKINMKLSEQRAQNIAEFLVKVANIDPARVQAVGMGDKQPIAVNDTPAHRAKNRRIEIIIKGVR